MDPAHPDTVKPTHEALPAPDGSTDPWLWLEDITGEDALAWARQRSQAAEQELERPGLSDRIREEARAILDASDRIPGVVQRGGYLYNLWKDAEHPRGLWRRTTLDSYRTEEPDWQVLLDIDALNEAEGEDWVWHGAHLLRPQHEDEPYRRALVDLSHGGSDADVTREFDLKTLAFVPVEDGGFVRPEAKGALAWIDEDTVWAATAVGEDTTTPSGYARHVRLWRRDTRLEDAPVVFEADAEDMSVFAGHDSTPGFERDWVVRLRAFYDTETILVRDREAAARGEDGALQSIDVPRDLEVMVHRDLMILSPRSDWQVGEEVFAAGSLVVADADSFLQGDTSSLRTLFQPTDSASLSGVALTRSTVVLTVMEDVVERLEVHTRDEAGQWVRQDLFPELTGSLAVAAVEADVSDEIWLTVTGFLTPTTLLRADLAPVPTGGDPEGPEVIKAAPARFDAGGLEVTQHFATSEDGTRVPYFQIGPAEEVDGGPQPTLMSGYGGFEISETPAYLGVTGKAWLERGGTYVLANIRGGGEYGPAWHQAALKEKRHRAYEDFAAVARDLHERGVTDPAHLAAQGGSNGGLLIGNMLVAYPELFGALVIQVPLLDMKRYSHLLAGASWMAEYGDPDTEDWQFLRTFSPYHLLDPARTYPPVLVMTSTRDDRVHPGHARKFTAALEGIGADVRYWENVEGGHGGAVTNEQAAVRHSLLWSFLHGTVGRGEPAADGRA